MLHSLLRHSTNRARPPLCIKSLFRLPILAHLSGDSGRVFPLNGHKPSTNGSWASASVAAICVLSATIPGTSHSAATTAAAQVHEAVDGYWQQAVTAQAREQKWRGARVSHSSTALDPVEDLPPCPQPIKIERETGSSSLLGRQRLQAICAASPGWSVLVSSNVDVYVQAVFASVLIERGETIGDQHIKLQELKLSGANRGFFSNRQDALGMGAKRRIRANQVLSPRLLALPTLIRRGQQVDIVANKQGISASTLGEALGDGQEGEVIRVRNLSSEKIIKAQVIDASTVTSTY